jgi:hypothetical protein
MAETSLHAMTGEPGLKTGPFKAHGFSLDGPSASCCNAPYTVMKRKSPCQPLRLFTLTGGGPERLNAMLLRSVRSSTVGSAPVDKNLTLGDLLSEGQDLLLQLDTCDVAGASHSVRAVVRRVRVPCR